MWTEPIITRWFACTACLKLNTHSNIHAKSGRDLSSRPDHHPTLDSIYLSNLSSIYQTYLWIFYDNDTSGPVNSGWHFAGASVGIQFFG
jgi:hypothetical protein